MYNLYVNNNNTLPVSLIRSLFHVKCSSEDTKTVTKKLINNYHGIGDHNKIMNETDRTIVGLLWHENIIDMLSKVDIHKAIPLYINILKNICYADYIDRVTFQKQIWQFNEMSSIIKTFHSNKLYHDYFSDSPRKAKPVYNPVEVRFTKVLTKYSTEYNNSTFIHFLCHHLGMDKRDVHGLFTNMKSQNKDIDNETLEMFDNCNISKLDINRMYRYLDKCIQNTNVGEETLVTDIPV